MPATEHARTEAGAFYRALVAIETDATRYYGTDASRPRVLDRSASEQMLAHIAADLGSLFPQASRYSLIAAGALFDQTQILRPAFPAYSALEAVVQKTRGDDFRPGLFSVGAEDGRMPDPALQPSSDIPLGLLQTLPLVVHGPHKEIEELGEAMENRFLEEGQLSPQSAQWLQSAFDISVTHARFMTLTDLVAMLRLQLEHFGFLPLWKLLDAALTGRREPLRLESSSGQVWEWRNGGVHLPFQTFDYWANRGAGGSLPAERQRLAGSYGDLTREVRQYLTTLRAHRIDLIFHRADAEGAVVEESYLVERGDSPGRPGKSSITEHSFAELGTVAVTVAQDGRVENYYPLLPEGLNDIHLHLRKTVKGDHTVAFPGNILYDERARSLQPDAGQ